MITKLLIAITALSFASVGAADAAKRHKRHKPVQHHVVEYLPASPYASRARPVWAQPWECFTDEGYGRFWPCGAGPTRR